MTYGSCTLQPRTYLKGSRRDETSGISNVVIGAGAAAVGGLVLAAGLLGGGSNASGQGKSAQASIIGMLNVNVCRHCGF